MVANIFVYRGSLRGYRFLSSIPTTDESSIVTTARKYLLRGMGIQILFRPYAFLDSTLNQIVSTVLSIDGEQFDEDGDTYSISEEISKYGGWKEVLSRESDPAVTLKVIGNMVSEHRSITVFRTPKGAGIDWQRYLNDTLASISLLGL